MANSIHGKRSDHKAEGQSQAKRLTEIKEETFLAIAMEFYLFHKTHTMKNATLKSEGSIDYNQQKLKTAKDKIIVYQQDKDWLEVYVPPHRYSWIQSIKKIRGRTWKAEKRRWWLPYVKATFYHLRDEIKLNNVIFELKIEANIPDVYLTKSLEPPKKKKSRPAIKKRYIVLNTTQQDFIFKVVEFLILSRYSHSTINVYRNVLIGLFHTFKYLPPSEIQPVHVTSYLLEQIQTKRISASTQNQIINAYKIFAEKILGRPKENIQIPRPRKSRKLPGVLSTKEVVRIINGLTNLKHKLILLLIYSSGLRVSEVVNILLTNLQIDRRAIHIKNAKGKNDRYVVLAESVLPYLKKYLEAYQPQRWLFEGINDERYSIRSVQSVFAKALKKSNVNAYATLHTLRHSYATHCLENGHNLKMIQQALGHKSLKTTEIYLHLSSNALKSLTSPLDRLEFE